MPAVVVNMVVVDEEVVAVIVWVETVADVVVNLGKIDENETKDVAQLLLRLNYFLILDYDSRNPRTNHGCIPFKN